MLFVTTVCIYYIGIVSHNIMLWSAICKIIPWAKVNSICHFMSIFIHVASEKVCAKAGRLVGLAYCYAIIVLAENATFLLAVNRIAAYRWHSAIIFNEIISCLGSAVWASAPQSWGSWFESHLGADFFTYLSPLRHNSRCGIILFRLRLTGQLQYRTALVCALHNSIYNMGDCIICHMLTFIIVMVSKIMCEMWYLICYMFSFICNVS